MKQAGRVDECGGAASVNIYFHTWIFANEGAGRCGVVKMDMSQKNSVEISNV